MLRLAHLAFVTRTTLENFCESGAAPERARGTWTGGMREGWARQREPGTVPLPGPCCGTGNQGTPTLSFLQGRTKPHPCSCSKSRPLSAGPGPAAIQIQSLTPAPARKPELLQPHSFAESENLFTPWAMAACLPGRLLPPLAQGCVPAVGKTVTRPQHKARSSKSHHFPPPHLLSNLATAFGFLVGVHDLPVRANPCAPCPVCLGHCPLVTMPSTGNNADIVAAGPGSARGNVRRPQLSHPRGTGLGSSLPRQNNFLPLFKCLSLTPPLGVSSSGRERVAGLEPRALRRLPIWAGIQGPTGAREPGTAP